MKMEKTMSETLTDWTLTVGTSCTRGLDQDCNGECFFDATMNALDLQTEWAHRNGDLATETVKVSSERMLWNGVSGYAVTEHLNVISVLALNAEYRLDFKLVGNTLTVNRYSHDEPTGAHFKVEFVPDDTEQTH